MNEIQLNCLNALHWYTLPNGEVCVPFAPIMQATGYDRAVVRRAVRFLARKGLAEFWRGLMTEDGELAGSGYCITDAGMAEIDRRARMEVAEMNGYTFDNVTGRRNAG